MKTIQMMMQEMFALQNSMNSKVSPVWSAMGWDWFRAIWLESAEAVEQMPWKWWKHTTTDEGQVKMELVDIWHFILSQVIEDDLADVFLFDFSELPAGQQFSSVNLIEDLEALASAALSRDLTGTVASFKECLYSSSMEFSELYSLYIGKNVLNMFRQDNGYKTGEYRKIWNGAEDNKRLVEVMMNCVPLAANYANDIYAGLTEAYQEKK